MGKITDETLDRMSSELLSLADFTQRQVETDDRHIDGELAYMLRELARDRGMLARFADLLVRHDTPQTALAELTALKAA